MSTPPRAGDPWRTTAKLYRDVHALFVDVAGTVGATVRAHALKSALECERRAEQADRDQEPTPPAPDGARKDRDP